MPELPEVETVKRGLSTLNHKVINNMVIRESRLRYSIPSEIINLLVGKTIIEIKRCAKYLLFILNEGILLIHLGMSGSLTLVSKEQSNVIKKHDHVDIFIDELVLRYNDPRRFGCMLYFKDISDISLFNNLGPEPLSSEFNSAYLLQKLKNKSTYIKKLIMDNNIVVGVGNIYACEALFMAKISPLRGGCTLTELEASCLVNSIKEVLKTAIELGGSTLRDYKTPTGENGLFQTVHKVYGREGMECTICKSVIRAKRLGQRNSFYCVTCQV